MPNTPSKKTMPASHVALAERMRLQKEIKNAAMRGDNKKAKELMAALNAVNAKINAK